jgi:hypothetical protein
MFRAQWQLAILVSAAFILATPLRADQIVLDSSKSNSSGVKIVAGAWNANVHADKTYNAFSTVKIKNNEKIGQYDFYYSLEIVPQFKATFANCTTGPNLASILKNLFGVAEGAVIFVKADVQYRWTMGTEVDFLKNDAGLVVAALGPSATQAQAGSGCYFDTTIRPTFPLLQYGGGGIDDNYDDFVMKFIVVGGSATSLKAVSTLVGLFSDISAAAGWASVVHGLAGPVSQNLQQLAGNFQTALQNASTLQNQVSVGYILKANGGANDGRLSISVPDLFSSDPNNGNLVIYVRRTGSIALANASPVVTLTTVLDNPELASRQCSPVAIASGNCNAASNGAGNIDPIRVAIAKLLKGLDSGLGDGTSPVVKLIDVTDSTREPHTYNICRGIRTVAREYLRLSTLDEMMIRWAFTKEGGLQAALKSAGALPKSWPPSAPVDPKIGEALSKATGAASLNDLADMCWNDGDQQTIQGVLQALGKTLQD